MTKHRASLFTAAVAMTFFAAGSVASAQQSRPHGESYYQAPQLQAPNNPYSDYPAAEVQAIPAAMARAAISRMELLRSQVTLDRGTRAAVKRFEKSDDMSKATAAQQEAYARYQAARAKALEPLQSDSQYLAAQELKKRLGDQIVEKHEAAAGAPDTAKPVLHEILAMATLKLRYSMAATNRETEALRQSAEVRDARTQLVSASTKVNALRTRFADDLREDPDLIAARKAVFDQKVAYVASHVYLDGLREARCIALDYAYFIHGYNPYRVMGYDPYGFGRSYYGYGNY